MQSTPTHIQRGISPLFPRIIFFNNLALLSQQLKCENKESSKQALLWAHFCNDYNYYLLLSHLTHAMY